MHQIPELKEKVREIYKIDFDLGMRIDDYLGNTRYIIDKNDYIIDSGKITIDQIGELELQYKKFIDKILSLPVTDILSKIRDNEPSEDGTVSNIESIKKAFSL